MTRRTPEPGLRIREDTVFAPGTYQMPAGEGMIIDADDIMVDGNGAILRAAAPAPPLPDGDYLYSPGDLCLSREPHELLARRIELGGKGRLLFEYRYWGHSPDPAQVAVSPDREHWNEIPAEEADRGEGWRPRRFSIGPWDQGVISLRLVVPAESLSPASPCFYDGFRLLHDGTPVWQGDARANWDRWYNTGFSIFKRAEKRFYAGTALRAEGRRGVRLHGFRVEGFLTGLHLKGCEGWTIERNDFTGNYDDPDYGWGEGTESFGGICLEDVRKSVLRANRGTRIWNGISMRRCDDNEVSGNEFSHCSNTCLKMAQSSRNAVSRNVFSWGLRIYPGEVHARDSVSMLLESGSDHNRFSGNDFTHGGDGVFIRVLDHWCSVGNIFEENDCSYANNNAFESWSPGNVYVRNKANHSSYGFWLGGSDDTTLKDNEVMHNGKTFRNAPEPFGNAGISVVHGSSSGFLVTGNRVVDNAGPGISFAYRDATPARAWLIAGNEIRNNRDDTRGYAGHGILVEHAEDVILGRNRIEGNEGAALLVGRSARHLVVDPSISRVVEGLRIDTAAVPVAGREVRLSVDGAPSALAWSFGDGTRERTASSTVAHVFAEPGRYRVSVVGTGVGAAGMATGTLCVLPPGEPLFDGMDAAAWRLTGDGARTLDNDASPAVAGGSCLRAVARGGTRGVLARRFPRPLDLSAVKAVSFFYRYSCSLSILAGKRTRTVGLRLGSGEKDFLEYAPEAPFKGEPSEDRYDWVYFAAPRESMRRVGSPDAAALTGIEIFFGPDAPADCIFLVDRLMKG